MVATARNPASGNPLRHIVVLPADDVLRSNTKDNTALAVFTLDAFGLPVPGWTSSSPSPAPTRGPAS